MPKTKGLTLKQRKFIDVYLETGNGTEAAMQAYDCKDRESAGAIATENLQKLSIDKLMERAGLSDALLLQKGKEGINANKVISANIVYGDADEGTQDFIEVPDHTNRYKYWNRLLSLKGHSEGSVEQQMNVQINLGEVFPESKYADKTPRGAEEDL